MAVYDQDKGQSTFTDDDYQFAAKEVAKELGIEPAIQESRPNWFNTKAGELLHMKLHQVDPKLHDPDASNLNFRFRDGSEANFRRDWINMPDLLEVGNCYIFRVVTKPDNSIEQGEYISSLELIYCTSTKESFDEV